MQAMADPGSLTVVANRLPVERGAEGWQVAPGGLVSALRPVLGEREARWVGWAGEADEELEPFEAGGIELLPVPIFRQELHDYYEGFSNTTLWPLYHDKVRRPDFHRHWWHAYRGVNQRFADVLARSLPRRGAVWIHDYHLSILPRMLRDQRPDLRIGFFLHIPFPSLALFAQLPWRVEVLAGMLGADALGFQTEDGAENFRHAAQRLLEVPVEGSRVHWQEREVVCDAQPISIDAAAFDRIAGSAEVERRVGQLRSLLGQRTILLGIDRLDYTKGIRARLRAFESFLDQHSDRVEQTVFVQVAVPSREDVTGYAEMREAVEAMVGRINGRYARLGQFPVHYFYDSLQLEELVAHYRAADVMVVTPPRDGMNLVAKEFVAARIHEDGALVLSEFAGAAHELRGALTVNPWDLDGMALAFERALAMPRERQRARMRDMRQTVFDHDVQAWARSALGAFGAVSG